MCYPVPCSTCGKTTWNGCGEHVADVRRNVPAAQWCDGHAEQSTTATGAGFLGRLFGRS
ncbi:hypothetical protein ABH923_001482 [Leifsonia sp. EB41]|jgi:hypothetical protein|uniref:hypothetical protein n=1 Tax=Leifsonia sp. EB41 TaxID=3156260 RepID=UPI003514B206